MLRTVVRSAALVAAAFLLVAADAEAQWARQVDPVGQVRFRLGIFEPAGGSSGWDRVFEGFTGQTSDLQDVLWGVDFLWRPGGYGSLMFGFSSYSGSTSSAYEDWVAGDGSEIRHTKRLEIADISVAWVYHFGSGGIRPYAGVGGGLLWWELTDAGDFIDFGDPELPIVRAFYGADGTTFEAFGLAGVDIPLSPAWSFFAEGRYRWASDGLGGGFAGFGDLDLSGWEVSGGFAIGF
jgi:hypothetical protein